MAVSAARTTKGAPRVQGAQRQTCTLVTFDSSYAGSGGESLTAAQLGLSTVDYAVCNIKTPCLSVVDVWYDADNQKIKANLVTAEAGAIDLSTLVVQVVAFGR